MTTNRVRNNLVKSKGEALSLQKCFSVLVATFVFVLGMLVGGTADAAKVTAEEVTRTATIELRAKKGEEKTTKTAPIKMTVKLENIDITAYAKYTAELRKNAKYGHVVFAKAAPGSQVSITAEAGVIPGLLSKPAKDMNYSETVNYYNHEKIETLKDLAPTGKVNGFGKKYTIPKDVEEVTAYVSVRYHVGFEVGKDMKASTGTYRQEPAITRHYYIFTSDAACKKAFDLMAEKSVAGTIASAFGGDKKPSAKSDSKQAGNKSDSKDSGTLETVIGAVIGVAVLGGIGYGAYRMFGKGRGSKGNGAGNYNNPASGPQPMQRPGAPTPNSYDPQPMQRPGAPTPNSYGPQPMQRPGAPTPNLYGPQPMQRPGAPTPNSYGPQPMQRPGAAKRAAAENVTYCKQCGAPMRSGSHFCKNCGARNLPDICPSCGAKLEPGDMFCGNCGMKV